MGVRITAANHQPADIGNLYTMMPTSAESNVLNVAASPGMCAKALTRWVMDSPIAMFIKDDLRCRNIELERPEIVQEGPWCCRHRFNIADAGCYNGYRCERLPASLLQAQRDRFGAHTYERVERPRGEFSTPIEPAREAIPPPERTIPDGTALPCFR